MIRWLGKGVVILAIVAAGAYLVKSFTKSYHETVVAVFHETGETFQVRKVIVLDDLTFGVMLPDDRIVRVRLQHQIIPGSSDKIIEFLSGAKSVEMKTITTDPGQPWVVDLTLNTGSEEIDLLQWLTKNRMAFAN